MLRGKKEGWSGGHRGWQRGSGCFLERLRYFGHTSACAVTQAGAPGTAQRHKALGTVTRPRDCCIKADWLVVHLVSRPCFLRDQLLLFEIRCRGSAGWGVMHANPMGALLSGDVCRPCQLVLRPVFFAVQCWVCAVQQSVAWTRPQANNLHRCGLSNPGSKLPSGPCRADHRIQGCLLALLDRFRYPV